MKKTLTWLLAVVILGGFGAWIAYKLHLKSLEKEEEKRRGVGAIAVEAVDPARESIRDLRTFTGTLRAWSLFEVAPKVSGRLQTINFDVGDRIQAGDVIARIEDIEYRQTVDQAEADLEISKAQLRQAEVMLDLRRREYDRQISLDANRATTQAMLESAQTAFQAQEATTRMEAATVKRNEALLENARLKLADCVITADWAEDAKPRYVGVRHVDEGALLAVNQPILSIAQMDRLLAVIHVIERDYPYIEVNQTAELTTDAYPGQVFTGRIIRVSQIMQNNTRNAEVQLEIPNDDLKLKPGMFVRVDLQFASRDNTTVVPRSAVVRRNEKSGVFLLNVEEAKAEFVPVETGIVSGNRIEIVAPELDRPVITLGNHLLTHDVPVLVPAQYQPEESPETAADTNE